MCPEIDNPVSYEIRAVILFLHAKNMSAAEIHRELCKAVYGQNMIGEGTVRQWRRMFKYGRTNVHDEERSVRPAICSDDFVQSGDQNIHQTNRKSLNKLSLSAGKLMDCNCFLGQERSTVGGIRETRDHNNIRRVLRNTQKKNCVGPFRTKGFQC
jgi:hypothetical protein